MLEIEEVFVWLPVNCKDIFIITSRKKVGSVKKLIFLMSLFGALHGREGEAPYIKSVVILLQNY